MCWSLFLIKACNFVKKRVQHRCYLVKFAKYLRTLFFTEYFFTVPTSVCSESLGKILVRNNKSHVGRHNFWEFFETIFTAVSLLLSWALYYICAVL